MDHERDDEPAPNKPADVIRDGNLKASIWRYEGDSGPFFATSFVRTYRDQDGEYRDTNGFVAGDLLRLSELARNAYTRTNALRREGREERTADGPEQDSTERTAFKEKRSAEGRSAPRNRDR